MRVITVKNLPVRLYDQLKVSAAINRRSIENEVIACLKQVLEPNRLSANEFLVEARSIRRRLTAVRVSEKDLKTAKSSGRA